MWDSNPRHSAYETELEPTPVHPAIARPLGLEPRTTVLETVMLPITLWTRMEPICQRTFTNIKQKTRTLLKFGFVCIVYVNCNLYTSELIWHIIAKPLINWLTNIDMIH